VKRTILAVPVIAGDIYEELSHQTDSVIALHIPEYFNAVGQYYQAFPHVTDIEVAELLQSER
jgi:putative phosphoribosyl transferase